MLISSQHEYAFLCMPKTGSTSTERMLWRHSNIKMSGGNPALKHTSATEMHQFILPFLKHKMPLKNIETVCVFREPMSWIQSWYKFRRREKLADPDHELSNTYTGDISFNQFVEKLLESNNAHPFGIRSQRGFVTFQHGEIAIDRLFRMEDLDEMVAWFSEKIGEPLELPKKNVSPQAELDISPENRASLEDLFEADFTIYENIAAINAKNIARREALLAAD
jgi:hypothetical protein